jgi:chemotaxis protein MotB
MNRHKFRRHSETHANVDRWLVSYADYMTLLFALFVVLYSMAMVSEKPFKTATESIGNVFQTKKVSLEKTGSGDDVLPVNSSDINKGFDGDGLLNPAGAEVLEGTQVSSKVAGNQMGDNLISLESQLNTALNTLVTSGGVKLQIDGEWLEVELKSGLLFPSGSSSITVTARSILSVIYDILSTATNFVRIRGYTDNEPINTEMFSSNWELSVFRATAILRLLEELNMNPARMAIEGYGEFYPSADNKTATGRAKNRKVVIAISKYGLKTPNVWPTPTEIVEVVEVMTKVINEDVKKKAIKIIQLEDGAIRITTREDQPIDNNK